MEALATIAAIIIGPLAAVLITNRIEIRRRKFESRSHILRMLLNTRGLPGDPSWSIAINSVPIEFHGETDVMPLWRNYLQAVRFKPSPGNEEAHRLDAVSKQTALIFSIAKKLKYSITENDIQNEAYYSSGYIERDNLMLDSWRALQRIAHCQEEFLKRIPATQA